MQKVKMNRFLREITGTHKLTHSDKMNCSACNKTLSADDKVYQCAGHGDDNECDNFHTTLCEACVSWDADEDTYHCSECFDQLYFTCDCCGETNPLISDRHMGTCYAEGTDCKCEDMCRDCFRMPEGSDGMCVNCYDKLYPDLGDCKCDYGVMCADCKSKEYK